MFLSKAPIRAVLQKQVTRLFGTTSHDLNKSNANSVNCPSHCDVAIIGGGAVGSSIAYWLKKRVGNDLNVVVIEKDKCYTKASTTLSVGGVRQQFSLTENIQLSLFAADDFLPNVKQYLGEDVNLNLTSNGYLMMATEASAECLLQNSNLQNQLGAENIILTSKQLNQKFPWLNTDNIALGCFGVNKEGWFDPYALLMGFKRKSQSLGATFVDGEVTGFDFVKNPASENIPEETPNKVTIRMSDGSDTELSFKSCVIAAGACSGEIAKKAKIGTGSGILSVPLPVVPRKRYVYVVRTQGGNAPDCNAPLTIDPNNTYFRPDGTSGNFLTGRSPEEADEPDCGDLNVDYDYFDSEVWPRLAHRVPAFESVKMQSAWSGYYEYNTFDENGIIGLHPYYNNVYIATGFSGHGIQQSPAVGRAISELIIDGNFKTIDLLRFGFERLVDNTPMRESNIV